MKIRQKTPRTEMQFTAIVSKMTTFWEALGEELGVGKEVVDAELSKFATLSARVEFDKGEMDFDVALVTDSPDEIRQNFTRYIDTSCYLTVEKALAEVFRADRPLTPPEQQPKLPEGAQKNS